MEEGRRPLLQTNGKSQTAHSLQLPLTIPLYRNNFCPDSCLGGRKMCGCRSVSPSLSPPPSVLSIALRAGPESLRASLFIFVLPLSLPLPRHRLGGGGGAGSHPRPLALHPSPGRWSPSCLNEVVQKGTVAAPFGCAWSRKFTNSKLRSQSKPPQPRWLQPVLPLTATAPRAARRGGFENQLVFEL